MSTRHFLAMRRKLLWVDCTAGLFVGTLVLLLHALLSRWYGLPLALVVFLGLTNVGYGLFSLSLTLRKQRPMRLVRVLALANMAWMFVCVGLVLLFFQTASPVGLALLLSEGVFVGGLGFLEWRSRRLLLQSNA